MNRRVLFASCVVLALFLGVVTLRILELSRRAGGQATVAFLRTESGYAPFPSMVESERFDFDFHNRSSKAGSVDLCAIQDEKGNWVPCWQPLDRVKAQQTTRLYVYLPRGTHPRGVRLRFLQQATAGQKAQMAVRLLFARIAGRYPGKTIWFDKLEVPADEFTVSLLSQTEPGAATAARANAPEANPTPARTGTER